MSRRDVGEVLDELAAVCAGEAGFTLDELRGRLADHAWPVLLLILPLPFLTPVPMLGLSLPFGLAIAGIGVGIALGREPWLPQRLRSLRCPPGFFARVFASAARLLGRLRGWVKPRGAWLAERAWTRWLSGCLIAASGILLALPVPVIFSNALPAWAILLTAAGLAQRDGFALLAGQIVFLATLAFFAALGWLAWAGTSMLV
jgi:hypothetical protein